MPQPKLPPALRQPVEWPWLLAGLLALATLISLAAARRRPAVWLFVTVLLMAEAWVACGGGNASSGGGGGSTAAPAVSFSATSLNFGQVALSHGSAAQTVTLTNSGNGTLSLLTIDPGGADYSDFLTTFDNCFNATVASGATCAVSLAFAPQAAGLRTATISFNDNASGSPQVITLSGTGVQPPTPAGTYYIGVIGTGSNLGHLATLTLTVQ